MFLVLRSPAWWELTKGPVKGSPNKQTNLRTPKRSELVDGLKFMRFIPSPGISKSQEWRVIKRVYVEESYCIKIPFYIVVNNMWMTVCKHTSFWTSIRCEDCFVMSHICSFLPEPHPTRTWRLVRLFAPKNGFAKALPERPSPISWARTKTPAFCSGRSG